MARNGIPQETYNQAKLLFLTPGITITQVAQSLNIAWQTAKKIAAKVERPLCECGRPAKHNGLCPGRVENQLRSIRADNNTGVNNEPEPVHSVEDVDPPEGREGRCVERPCAFPAIRNFRCKQHSIDYMASFSLISSTMNNCYFLSQPKTGRSPMRRSL
jgi:hypothetical protein